MIAEGLASVLMNPICIIWVFIGTLVGIVFGCIPGLTATMAIAMFLPVTYNMAATQGISVLTALYIGGISGGLISAILLNIPGTPASIATCLDGHPLAKKGLAGKALGVGIVFSFLGTMISLLALVLISPPLASIAIKFGPFEYFSITIFSLTLIITLSSQNLVKGIMTGVLGLVFATVGLAPVDSVERYTFGNPNLNNGFDILTVLVGVFAISEIILAAETAHAKKTESRNDSNRFYNSWIRVLFCRIQIPNRQYVPFFFYRDFAGDSTGYRQWDFQYAVLFHCKKPIEIS